MVPAANKSRAALRLRGIRRHFGSGIRGSGIRASGIWTAWLRRPRREVLTGVDLDVAAGECVGLAGPNGSGKTTLLRIVAGLDRPSAGELEVLGSTPDRAAVRRRIGYLGEDSPYPGELTAAAALDLFAALHGLPRAGRRAQVPAMLERVGLAREARSRLGRFSRGMLRRFGLAQAFLHGPELVVLDEPSAGLDAPGYGVLSALLQEARERGTSVLLCSHVVADLTGPCDRVEVLFGGRVAARAWSAERARETGRWEAVLEGSQDDPRAALERYLSDADLRVVSVRPAALALEELYRELDAGQRGDA